ncbi:hypothetical protein MSP8886_03276 [Marinomonas spartinae]|uniref:Uncharacterized protein n=1 Tax=Marinomonas spartinae TaxID=1792290 RepID=A0A1A8TPA6_9GAMM|nr:hypothetical protein MSP8886_03276 [Marinomonas spartinae]
MVFCKEIDGKNADLSTLLDISYVTKGVIYTINKRYVVVVNPVVSYNLFCVSVSE